MARRRKAKKCARVKCKFGKLKSPSGGRCCKKRRRRRRR